MEQRHDTDALPRFPGCAECGRLRAAEEAARAERDPSAEVDARVMARRHLREVHRTATVVGR